MDKVIGITGASGGLGKALCLRFGRAGAKIAALDVDKKGLEDLQKVLTDQGIPHAIHPCDITSENAVKTAFQTLQDTLGPIDTLINNAGITHLGTALNTPISVYRKVMEVNLIGSINCTQTALPQIIEQQGMIVSVSSVAGFAPLVGRTAYAASKHAMHGYFESLRAELKASKVAVLMVCPASIDTPIRQRSLGMMAGDNLMEHTTGRSNSAEEVAEMIFRAVNKTKTAVGHRVYWQGVLVADEAMATYV